jgi:hypothetical protein
MDRLRPLQARADAGLRLHAPARNLRRSLLIGGHPVRLDVAQLGEKEAVIGLAAELAIGDEAQTHPLLKRHRVPNGLILRQPQDGLAHLPEAMLAAQLQKPGRTKKAADMFGAEWRLLQLVVLPWVALACRRLGGAGAIISGSARKTMGAEVERQARAIA